MIISILTVLLVITLHLFPKRIREKVIYRIKRLYLIHGSKDTIVPMSCSEKFVETYTQDAELIVVEGENHMITKKLKTVVTHAVSFFTTKLK